MADTVFWMYPTDAVDLGPGGWTIDPSAHLVDEPHDVPDDSDFFESMPVATPVTWRAAWAMSAPASAVVITGVKVFARIWAHSQNSTPHHLTDIKAVTIVAGSTYYDGSQTITGSTGASGPNPQTYLLGTFATNPDTGLAWTIPELQAGVFGLEYTDQDFGSNTPETLISQVFVEVDAQTIAQSIEGVRAQGSHYLLTLGRLHGVFEMMLPPEFVDVEPGEVVSVIDRLGPASAGQGWGRKVWQRREALVLENEWSAMVRRVRLVLFDLRFFRLALWWQPFTDLAYTEEGQGIPYLDSGGGYTFERAAFAYVRKQGADILYAQVPQDLPKWTASGLQIGGGDDVAETINNSLSQGAGASTFDSWSVVASGSGAVVQDLADVIFDVTGLRRSAAIASGLTGGSTAYLEQAHTITGVASGRVAILFKYDGGDVAAWRLQRAADSFFWNDGTGAWTATPTDNAFVLSGTNPLRGYYSKTIAFAAGADTYTLRVGYMTGAAASSQTHLYFATVIRGARADVDGFRSLDVTTTAPVTRVRDDLRIANATPVRVWDPTRGGQIELRIETLFEHVSMEDGEQKPILFCEGRFDEGEEEEDGDLAFECITYLRVSATEGRWRLHRHVGGEDYFADVVVTSGFPALFEEWKLAARWTGPEEELDFPESTLWMYANGVWSDPTVATAADMAEASTVFVGWNPATEVAGDFTLRALRMRKVCLTDDETVRELG